LSLGFYVKLEVSMRTLLTVMGAGLLAVTAFAGTAEARPGRGHAYGHYKHHDVYRAAPYRGYYAAPRYGYRRSNGGAVAAGVAGAIIGGALSAAQQPTYRAPTYGYYDRPAYGGYYTAPPRYYRNDYYGY
jgi:hypothetical protein